VAVNGQGTETVELCSVRFRMVDSSAEKNNLAVMENPPWNVGVPFVGQCGGP